MRALGEVIVSDMGLSSALNNEFRSK